MSENWPKTVDEAIQQLMETTSDSDKRYIAAQDNRWLIQSHHSFGRKIRNDMGLWQSNNELLESTGEENSDDASYVIVRAFWLHLRGDYHRLVSKLLAQAHQLCVDVINGDDIMETDQRAIELAGDITQAGFDLS